MILYSKCQTHKDFIRTQAYETTRQNCELAFKKKILSLSSPSKGVRFLYWLRYQPHSSCFIDVSCHSCMSYSILYKTVEIPHWFTLKYKCLIVMSISPRFSENNGLLLKRNKFQMEEHHIWLCAFRIKLWAHVNKTGQFF